VRTLWKKLRRIPMGKKKNVRVIQPKDIATMLNMKSDQVESAVSTALSFLIYMKPGDELHACSSKFIKLADNSVYIKTAISKEDVIDSLESVNIIKLPV
jgi:hypothetical protein